MMSTMCLLLFGAAVLLTVAGTDAASPPRPPREPPCNLIDCASGYICVERGGRGDCIKQVIKPGECPMYKCAVPINPCNKRRQCQHDGDCPGSRKCCWGCDGCYSCLSVPLPSGPRCGDQVCQIDEVCKDVTVYCLVAPCPQLKQCVREKCAVPAYPGPCEAAITRYYYDYQTRSCRTFTWGGCNANGNNFETEAECLAYCQR